MFSSDFMDVFFKNNQIMFEKTFNLIVSYDLDKLSITKIIETFGIAKQTFYTHYIKKDIFYSEFFEYFFNKSIYNFKDFDSLNILDKINTVAESFYNELMIHLDKKEDSNTLILVNNGIFYFTLIKNVYKNTILKDNKTMIIKIGEIDYHIDDLIERSFLNLKQALLRKNKTLTKLILK